MANKEMMIDSMRPSWVKGYEERVVVLQEKGRNRFLPIWIGPAEGDAIAMKMEGVSPPRPQTHDFACAAIDALGGSLESVVIHKLENDVLHAKMIIRAKGGLKEIDCRPSDAMAVALRAGVPILADEEVLNRTGFVIELPSESAGPPPVEMSEEQQTDDEE